MVRRILTFLSAALWMAALASCASPVGEPKNLTLLKEEIAAYVDSGEYLRQVAGVANDATAWIERRAGQGGGRLAVVFDIDETVLSNLAHMRAMDFGYQPEVWTAWVARAEAVPIEPVCAVYRTARLRGVEVIFITSRREADRSGTEKNLRAAGLGDYAKLILKPNQATETSAEFKTGVRRRLSAEGYVIIANLGDQQSDLDGGFAERTFKVPGPFYLTR